MYLFFLGKITKEVQREKKKLISNRDLVRENVESTSKSGGGTVNYAVFRWLNDVEELIQDEESLARETKTVLGIAIYHCIPWGLLPSVRRNIYEGFHDMLEEIKTLNTKCEFEVFFNSIPGSDYSSPSFVCFESQKLASDQLFEALQDNTTCVIGLHGKPGTGKTQLVKAVAERAKYMKIFDRFGFATVSQDPNVNRIQNEIADSSGLNNFESTTILEDEMTPRLSPEDEMARRLSRYLRSCRVLVILDDVQAKFDLESIGFATRGTPCGSKVLLITRSKREYVLVDCQREVLLHPLLKEEAWTLFKNHSGINESSSSDLLKVAQEVAFECEGSPGTIIKAGSSLKSEPIEEWKASLYALRHSTARYHIFLSFRGDDTRYSFTGFLYRALCQGRFKTFMDDGKEGLHGGDLISPSLIEAVETSRLSIIVLSENYAHSSWCLDELVKILECMKMKIQLVFPIFYKVEPSDVRYQSNSYGNAMVKHEKRFGTDSKEVQKWKSALFEVSNLPGKVYKTGCEYKFIQEIVEYVNSIKRALYLQSMDMD